MTAVAKDARAKGLRVTPLCGYAAAWFRRNDAFQDVLA
jgi:predicted GNAT family acetyltransferase